MIQSRFRLLVLFTISYNYCFSQFNDTTNYYINFGSTGVISKTNDRRSYVLNNNLRFSMYKKNVSMNTSHSFMYGKQQESLVNRDLSSSVDFNLFKTLKHFYYWGLGSYERSFSLKINQRLQSGLGLGYHLVDRKQTVIIISDGILYEKSDLFDRDEAADIQYETLRNSFRLKFRFLIGDIITFEGTDFLQHALSDRHDYIIRSMTNLSIKLMKWLSFTMSVTYNKLNRTGRENLLLNFGLSMEKYF